MIIVGCDCNCVPCTETCASVLCGKALKELHDKCARSLRVLSNYADNRFEQTAITEASITWSYVKELVRRISVKSESVEPRGDFERRIARLENDVRRLKDDHGRC